MASTVTMTGIQEQRIEQVRRNYEAYSRGDFDAVIATADPQIVLVRAGGQGEVAGPTELRRWMEPDAFESQVLEPDEFRALGDKVLVHLRGSLRGANSGIEMPVRSWTVWTFGPDGRIRRIEIFLEHEEATALRAFQLEV